MDRQKKEAIIEAILFAMGDSVEVKRLAEVIEEEIIVTKSLLHDMMERYGTDKRGMPLIK